MNKRASSPSHWKHLKLFPMALYVLVDQVLWRDDLWFKICIPKCVPVCVPKFHLEF